MERPRAHLRAALTLAAVALLAMPATLPMGLAETRGGGGGGEDRLPGSYLTVFYDDFESTFLDTSKWSYWRGNWSTDNVAKTPDGGIYPGDNVYMTESPLENGFGSPLDGNGNDGLYYPEERSMIETAWIDLSNLSTPRLEFNHMYDIPTQGDGAMVYVKSESRLAWELVRPDTEYPYTVGWSGKVLTWEEVTIRLDEYAGERVRIGFLITSTPDGVEGDGWWIDEVIVGGKPGVSLPDLKFGNARIYVGGYPVSTAVGGDLVELNMSVINEGRAFTGPFMVSAYTEHPLRGGELIGNELVLEGLTVGSTTYVTMEWVASVGEYELMLVLDELNQVSETDELNNERFLELLVNEPSSGDAALKDMHFQLDGRPVLGVGVGDVVSIVATLANPGNAPVTTPLVVRAYDGNPFGGGQVIGDEQPSFNGLDPLSERTIVIHWRPPMGNHTIHMAVLPQINGTVLDFNPANNITSARLAVTDTPGVDLTVETLELLIEGSPARQGNDGDEVRILATVGNAGTESHIGMVEVSAYVGDPDAGGSLIATKLVVGELAPEGTAELEFDWRAELGSHAIFIWVDPANLVYESDEDMNQLGKSLTIAREPLADLVVDEMHLLLNGVEIDPAQGTNEGANVEVNITIRNAGNVETQGPTVAELYNGNPLLSGISLGTIQVPVDLFPDEVLTVSFFWDAQRPTQRSVEPVLFVLLDSKGTEPEVNEFNNLVMRRLPVGAKLPDLTVSTVELLDLEGLPVDEVTYGTQLSIRVTVTNVGTDSTYQAADVEIYLDDTDAEGLIKTVTTLPLYIDESVTETVTWKPVPSRVDGGAHEIIAVVDPYRVVDESSDANNRASAEISVDADANPNLLVFGITVFKMEKEDMDTDWNQNLPENELEVVDRLVEGDMGYILVMIRNLGTAPLYSSVLVELFHGELESGGQLIKAWQVDELPMGEAIRLEEVWTFEEERPLVVVIDRTHEVKETNENDNRETLSLIIEPEPEGANWAFIGGLLGLGVLVFVLLALLLARRPAPVIEPEPELGETSLGAADEVEVEVPGEETPSEGAEEEEGKAPEEEAPEEEATEEEAAEEEARTGEDAKEEAAPTATCPHCGEEVDPEWILCPFCENELK